MAVLWASGMDTWRIEYSKEFAPGELTDWVNEALDQGQDEEGVKKGSRGYAQIVVEVGGESKSASQH